MIKEATGFGATIEEAKEKAIKELGASELDDIQFDVIKMPKKKALGLFGGNDAEVRVYIEVPDEKPSKNDAKPAKGENKPKENKKEAKKASQPKPAVQKKETVYGDPIPEDKIDADSPEGKAIAYLRTVIGSFGCEDISITVENAENASMITLDGEDISIIIGRRGETLDALQYLCSLAANNGGGHHKISLNIGNYREKRAETLSNLASRISAQVIKTGKSRTLEPMNPYERRIIHTAVQEIEGVESKSFGEGVGRRIVIFPEGTEARPPRMGNDRRRGNRRNGRPRSDRRSSNIVTAPQREPKKDTDIPLYGKIN